MRQWQVVNVRGEPIDLSRPVVETGRVYAPARTPRRQAESLDMICELALAIGLYPDGYGDEPLRRQLARLRECPFSTTLRDSRGRTYLIRPARSADRDDRITLTYGERT